MIKIIERLSVHSKPGEYEKNLCPFVRNQSHTVIAEICKENQKRLYVVCKGVVSNDKAPSDAYSIWSVSAFNFERATTTISIEVVATEKATYLHQQVLEGLFSWLQLLWLCADKKRIINTTLYTCCL